MVQSDAIVRLTHRVRNSFTRSLMSPMGRRALPGFSLVLFSTDDMVRLEIARMEMGLGEGRMPWHRGCLLLVMLAGCVSPEPSRTGTPWQSFKDNPDPERILLDVAIVQRPFGDAFLDDEIWSHADEMIVPPEQRDLLELNGYRAGVIVGSPPEKLVNLLQSSRSRVQRRARSVGSGILLTQTLRESDDEIDATIRIGKTSEEAIFDRPLFGFDLLPMRKSRSLVHLKLTPRVEAGDKSINYKPVPEESKWSLEVKRPTRVLSELAIDIPLAADQVLIVGPRLEREGTIGFHSFASSTDEDPAQRLLVVRHLQLPNAVGTDTAEVPYPAASTAP